jgi:ATP-binding cassette subfamily C protein
VALFARAMPLLSALQQCWQNWLHGVPALRETLALKERLLASQEHAPLASAPASRLDRAIEIEGVRFSHEGSDQPALSDVSLTLPARSFTALVGPSGAGKSTLADIVGGLISPDAGTVTVDGASISGPMRRSWRESVAYVQQEPLLFHATIAENLRWAKPDATAAAMQTALESASAQFVMGFEHGLETVVGDRGGRLSGGERQRIALARALLRNPALLILDEPTSSLDSASEAAICTAIEQLKGRITILLIAHRGSLTALADQIVTLDCGHIVDRLDTTSDN